MAEDLDFLSSINNGFKKEAIDISALSSLTLAFIGDSCYELIMRTAILCNNTRPNPLSRKAQSLAKATTQALIADCIVENDLLDSTELAVYKRGRNSHSPSSSKNASISQYRRATGLEALIGYLYLNNNISRAVEILNKALALLDISLDLESNLK